MNVLKKITSIIMFLIISSTSLNGSNKNINNIETLNINTPLRVSVLVNNSDLAMWKSLSENMKKIEQENPGIIHYTFYTANNNSIIQENQIKDILSNKNADMLMLDLVDVTYTKRFIDIIKQYNIPVICSFNADKEAIQSYEKAFYAATDPNEAGILDGNIIVDIWKKNKKIIDKNNNNEIEYVMLLGAPNNIYSIGTSKYSILTIQNNKIQTKELASKYCSWNEQIAKMAMTQIFLGFGNNIEAVIAVDDGMAIGAVKALQQYGYNLDNNEKKIVVIGVGGVPEAIDFIKKGYMTGTAVMDPVKTAKDFYTLTINLANNKNIIYGTNCTIDSSGKLITIPFTGVVVNFDYLK